MLTIYFNLMAVAFVPEGRVAYSSLFILKNKKHVFPYGNINAITIA
jgi:glycine betaine/choline ABC-type transport system substrate-binding protein